MESSNGTVLLVGQNLFFLGKIEAVAEPMGFTVQRATTEPIFIDQYAKNSPALILVDLEGDESVWSQVLGDLAQSAERANGSEVAATVVAFGPHENVEMLERAKNLGCDLVLNKGEFNRDLAKIIEKLRADLV